MHNQHIAYSVVARVEPELEDLSDEFRREEGRLEDRRDPCEMLLLVSLESAGVSDSYDVRVRVIGGDLSARAEKYRPHMAMIMCDRVVERCPPRVSSYIDISTCGQKHFDAIRRT